MFTQRRVLPVAVLFAATGAALAPMWWARLLCGGFAVLATGMAVWQRRARPSVVIDGEGYAVEEWGQEKLRVGWGEVVTVRADAAEHACYVDCGDRARNLLVPPRAGYGFRFERAAELYARILDAVPDKVELVPRLDAPPVPIPVPGDETKS